MPCGVGETMGATGSPWGAVEAPRDWLGPLALEGTVYGEHPAKQGKHGQVGACLKPRTK